MRSEADQLDSIGRIERRSLGPVCLPMSRHPARHQIRVRGRPSRVFILLIGLGGGAPPLGLEPRTCGLRARKGPSVRCWDVRNVRRFRQTVQEIRAVRCGALEFCSCYCSWACPLLVTSLDDATSSCR